MRTALLALFLCVWVVNVAVWDGEAATPPVPMISAAVTGPGPIYPNPAVSVVPTAAKVEDFPVRHGGILRFRNGERRPLHDAHHRPEAQGPEYVQRRGGLRGATRLGGWSLSKWSRVSILTRRHMFVEIVHSPANISLLKTFNAERYASLNIVMGQTNDVIAQAGMLIKSGTGPFAAYPARKVTLMGTSASSGTVRNYLADHAALRTADGGPIFDGFLLTSTNGNTPLPIVDVPMIQMPTQTEVVTWAERGIAYRRPDSDEPGNRFRLYEVAGMPHNNSRDSPVFQSDPCTLPVTDFPAGAFTALGLNYLVEWITKGTAPPHAPPIAVDQNTANDGSHLALDEHGNATGGIRNVWVDLPIANKRRLRQGQDHRSGLIVPTGWHQSAAARGDAEEAVSTAGPVRGRRRPSLEGAHRAGMVPAGGRGHGPPRRQGDHGAIAAGAVDQ